MPAVAIKNSKPKPITKDIQTLVIRALFDGKPLSVAAKEAGTSMHWVNKALRHDAGFKRAVWAAQEPE